MQNLSVLSHSSNHKEHVTKLLSEITNICDQLVAAFEVSSDNVMSYGFSLADDMHTEFVDRVIVAIDKLKLHVADLHHYLADFDQGVIAGLVSIQATLTSLLLSNNYYLNTFALPISELQADIQGVLDEVKISVAA